MRAFAGFPKELTPPPTEPFERAFDRNREGFRCTFHDGTTVWLKPGRGQAVRLRFLADALRQRAPVYVEVDDEDAISMLRLPVIGRALPPRQRQDGDFDVEFVSSQAVHRLRRSNPDRAALQSALERGHARNEWLLVTSNDSQDILHIAAVPPDLLGTLGPPEGEPRVVPSLVARWLRWIVDWTTLLRARTFRPPPSEAQAKQLFDLVAGKTCATVNLASDCIPFLFPNRGCNARAHEMCRLIIQAGFAPRKIWIDRVGTDYLLVQTRNHPECEVRWTWHVAPLLEVATVANGIEEHVIDPALFDVPVPRSVWVARIPTEHGSVPTIQVTDWTSYDRTVTDEFFTQTNDDLAKLRKALDEISNLDGLAGPPPYAKC